MLTDKLCSMSISSLYRTDSRQALTNPHWESISEELHGISLHGIEISMISLCLLQFTNSKHIFIQKKKHKYTYM